MTIDLGMWPITLWIYEGFHITSINQVVSTGLHYFWWDQFQIFSLKTSPQITFDLVMWPLTSHIYEAFHIISINQVLFQLDFIFSNDTINFKCSALQLDLRWPWPCFVNSDLINIWIFPHYINNPSFVPIRFQFFKWCPFQMFSLIQLDLRWSLTFYVTSDLIHIWTFYIISINQVKLQTLTL